MRTVIIIVVAAALAFAVGMYVGQRTAPAPAGAKVSSPSGKAEPTAKDSERETLELELAMAISAASKLMAAEMVNNLEKGSSGREAIQVVREYLRKTRPQIQPRPEAEEDADKVYHIEIGNAPTIGPEKAPVTIVEFTEFQCPFCGRGYQEMKKVKEEFGDKVRFVFKSKVLPGHSKAPLAHAAAYAAGAQGKFWEFHDRIFENQSDLTREAYINYAKELGLDLDRFTKDMDSKKYEYLWESDDKQADSLGVRGTPTYFINGKKVRGYKPFEFWKEEIEAILKGGEHKG